MKTSKGTGQGGLVYSTEHGKMCPACAKPMTACVCRQAKAVSGDGTIRVRLETKGRKGKGVTLITGVPLAPSELAQLGKQLKQKCGSGGTVKDGVIEVQGDHRESLVEALKKLGWNVKK
jgi:translation initiation factor 1